MKSVRKNELAQRVRLLVLGGLVASVGAFAACGGDEDSDSDSNSGTQGSACSSDSQCGDGLVCVPTATQSLEQKDLAGCQSCLEACMDLDCLGTCLASAACQDIDCDSECGGDAACVAECEDMLAGGGGGGGGTAWEDATPGMCTNTCDFADDGECDDGRPGSETDFCDPGTDCNDCGAVPGGDTPQPDPPTCEEFCAELPAESQAACIADCSGVVGATTCEEFCGAFPADFQAGCLADCEAGDTPIGGGTGSGGDGGSSGGSGNTATGTCQPDPNAGGGDNTPDAGGGDDAGPTCDNSDVEGNACAEAEDCNVECDCGVTAGSCSAGACDGAAATCESACADMAEMGAPAFAGSWCR